MLNDEIYWPVGSILVNPGGVFLSLGGLFKKFPYICIVNSMTTLTVLVIIQ